MSRRRSADLVYEHMLLSRHAASGAHPDGRRDALDRSATVLLARLVDEGPMTVAELADAFDLDVSTIHRQVAAAMKHGLVERIDDPGGGLARKHRPTPEGEGRLRAELDVRGFHLDEIVAEWPEEDLNTFVTLLRRFNQSSEQLRAKPWPRRDS